VCVKRHQASALPPVPPPHRLTGPRLGNVFAWAAPKVVNHAERNEEEGERAGEDEDHRALDAEKQGLTLAHFSAQLKRLLYVRGCIKGLFRGCLGGGTGYWGRLGCVFVSETAQVELNSGRV
jgi:hypothetical protein